MGTKSHQKHPIQLYNTLYPTAHENSAGFVHSNTGSSLVFVPGGVFLFSEKIQSHRALCSCFRPTQTPHPQRHKLKFSRNGAVLRIRWSKTLQHREGILLIPLPLIPGSDLCPVTTIHHYFQLVPADVNSPFFCVPQGPLLQPITFSLFSSFLKETITAIGLDATNFSPDSFRRGSATHVYQPGVPDHLTCQAARGLALERL